MLQRGLRTGNSSPPGPRKQKAEKAQYKTLCCLLSPGPMKAQFLPSLHMGTVPLGSVPHSGPMVLGDCQRPACKPLGFHVRAASPQGLESLDSPFLELGMLTWNQTYCGTEGKVPPEPLAVPKGWHLTTAPCRTLAAHQLQAEPLHLQQVRHFYFSQNITCNGKQLGILVSRKTLLRS